MYVHRAEILRQGKWFGERLDRMVVEHYYSLDIDDEVDFLAAEAVMRQLMAHATEMKAQIVQIRQGNASR